MKVVRLSALRTGRRYPPENIPGTHFCKWVSRPQGHSATRRIVLMKNSNDTIRNRTRDLPACSSVPQPTAPPRAPETLLFSHYCFSTATKVTRTRLNVTLYVHCLSCFTLPLFAAVSPVAASQKQTVHKACCTH
jgi:hypothetical protein